MKRIIILTLVIILINYQIVSANDEDEHAETYSLDNPIEYCYQYEALGN